MVHWAMHWLMYSCEAKQVRIALEAQISIKVKQMITITAMNNLKRRCYLCCVGVAETVLIARNARGSNTTDQSSQCSNPHLPRTRRGGIAREGATDRAAKCRKHMHSAEYKPLPVQVRRLPWERKRVREGNRETTASCTPSGCH